MAYAPLGGRLYIVGVVYDGDACLSNASVVYDPASHTLVRPYYLLPMRSSALGAAAQGKFFLMGGREYSAGPYGDGIEYSMQRSYHRDYLGADVHPGASLTVATS